MLWPEKIICVQASQFSANVPHYPPHWYQYCTSRSVLAASCQQWHTTYHTSKTKANKGLAKNDTTYQFLHWQKKNTQPKTFREWDKILVKWSNQSKTTSFYDNKPYIVTENQIHCMKEANSSWDVYICSIAYVKLYHALLPAPPHLFDNVDELDSTIPVPHVTFVPLLVDLEIMDNEDDDYKNEESTTSAILCMYETDNIETYFDLPDSAEKDYTHSSTLYTTWSNRIVKKPNWFEDN